MGVLGWIGLLLVLAVAQVVGHGHHHGHFHIHRNVTRVPIAKRATAVGRSNIFIDDTTCGRIAGGLSQIFENVLTVVTAAQSAIPGLESALGKPRSELSANEKSKVDLFTVLYGEFDTQDLGDLYIAKQKLDNITNFLDRYVAALSSNSFHLDVYCNENVWRNTGVRDDDGDWSFELIPQMGESMTSDTQNPCDEAIVDQYGQSGRLAAFTSPSRGGQKDFVTVCSDAWDGWNEQLPARRAGGYGGLGAEELDEILDNSPESTFLHELTHVESLFGENGVMEDIDLREVDDKAYKFEGCTDLADEDKAVTDVNEMRPLANADTFTYFLCGLYMGACNWSNGFCRDPTTVV